MRIGLDTNVLIQAHLPGLGHHELARDYLLEQLALPEVSLVVTPLVLHELVHIITDHRRFDPPVTMGEALAIARGYVARSNVDCLPVDEDSLLRALDMLGRNRLGRNRVADALLAGTLLTHGVHRLATFNAADFALFAPLQAFEPRLAPPDPEAPG